MGETPSFLSKGNRGSRGHREKLCNHLNLVSRSRMRDVYVRFAVKCINTVVIWVFTVCSLVVAPTFWTVRSDGHQYFGEMCCTLKLTMCCSERFVCIYQNTECQNPEYYKVHGHHHGNLTVLTLVGYHVHRTS